MGRGAQRARDRSRRAGAAFVHDAVTCSGNRREDGRGADEGAGEMTDVTTNNREVDADDVAGAEESAKHVVDERTAVATRSSPPKAVPHFTPAEHAARGRAARQELPRSAHGAWEPAPRRRDPVDLLEEQAQTRLPELGPIRYGRMLSSPFAFFRGGAYLMAADLADGARTGLLAQLCGDAHLSNFGIFAVTGPEAGLQHQRLRRDAARAVRVGREAPRREPRGRRTGPWLRRGRAALRGDGDRARIPRGNGAVRPDADHRRLVHASRRRGHPEPAQGRTVGQAAGACPFQRRRRADEGQHARSLEAVPHGRRRAPDRRGSSLRHADRRRASPARSSSTWKTSHVA